MELFTADILTEVIKNYGYTESTRVNPFVRIFIPSDLFNPTITIRLSDLYVSFCDLNRNTTVFFSPERLLRDNKSDVSGTELLKNNPSAISKMPLINETDFAAVIGADAKAIWKALEEEQLMPYTVDEHGDKFYNQWQVDNIKDAF